MQATMTLVFFEIGTLKYPATHPPGCFPNLVNEDASIQLANRQLSWNKRQLKKRIFGHGIFLNLIHFNICDVRFGDEVGLQISKFDKSK